MSKYSGKCDLWDTLVMIGELNDDSDWEKVRIYQLSPDSMFTENGITNTKRLPINSLKDLLPYAGFIPFITSREEDSYTIYIGETSYIDSREEEYIKRIADYYRPLINEKFSAEEICNAAFRDRDLEIQVINTIKSGSAINNLHVKFLQLFRDELVSDMVSAGYSKEEAENWVYRKEILWT